MLIIPPTDTNILLRKGALVPEEQELRVIIHALSQEYDKTVQGRGDRYGKLSIDEMDGLIGQLTDFADCKKGS